MGIVIDNVQLKFYEALSHTHLEHGKALHFLLCGVRDPRNISACVRIAAAFGSDKIFIDPLSSAVLDFSLKCVLRGARQKFFQFNKVDPVKFIESFKGNIVCFEVTKYSKPIQMINFNGMNDILLVFGNEAHGIPEEVLSLPTLHAHLSMYGKCSSVNVSSCAAIACYHIAYVAS